MTGQPQESSRNKPIQSTDSDVQPGDGSISISVAASVGNTQHPTITSADIGEMEQNQAIPQHPVNIAGAVSPAHSTTSSISKPDRTNQHGAELFSAAGAPTSIQSMQHQGRSSTDIITMERNQASPGCPEDIAGTDTPADAAASSIDAANRRNQNRAEVFSAARAPTSVEGKQHQEKSSADIITLARNQESEATKPLAAEVLRSSGQFANKGQVNSSPATEYSATSVLQETHSKSVSLGSNVKTFKSGASERDRLALSAEHFSEPEDCRMDNLVVLSPIERKESLVDGAMATCEEEVSKESQDGGMPPSLSQPDVLTKTRACFDSETARGVAKVIESQQIGGETLETPLYTPKIVAQQPVFHFDIPLNNSVAVRQTQPNACLLDGSVVAGEQMLEGSHEFGGSASNLPALENTDKKANQLESVTGGVIKKVFVSEKTPGGETTDMQNPTLANAKQQEVEQIHPRIHLSTTAKKTRSDMHSVDCTGAAGKDDTPNQAASQNDAGEDVDASNIATHGLKRKRTKQTSSLHKQTKMQRVGMMSHNRIIEAKDSLNDLTRIRYYNLRSKTTSDSNVSRRKTIPAGITNTVSGTEATTKQPSRKAKANAIWNSTAPVSPVPIDRPPTRTRGTRTKTDSSEMHDSDVKKGVDGASTTNDNMASSGEGTSASNSSSSKQRRRHVQRRKRRGDRKRTNQLLLNGSGLIHPVCVISQELAEQFWDTSIVLQGYHRTRISLTNWVTSFCLINHIGSRIRRKATWSDEATERLEIGSTDLCDDDVFTVMCPVGDLDEDSVIELIRENGGPVNKQSDFALLLIVAKVPQNTKGNGSSPVDWPSLMTTVRAGKPNLVKPDGASHFGSQGEAYGFGLRGGYEKLTPSNQVSVGQYASKPNSQDLSNKITEAENICGTAIAEAASTLDDKLPGLIRSITSPLRSIADCAKKNPQLEPLVRRHSTYGDEKKAIYFQSFFLNVNAATQVLHSEKDCSYTMIYSPNEANNDGQDVRFEFAITTEHTLEILMEAGLVFCYSAYVLTHRQVIHSGNDFINLSAYGNKHYYDNSKRSIQRLLRRDTVPPFRLSSARIISNLPIELLESMALQAQALFSKRSKVHHITNSNLEQVRREGADKKDLFFIPQELDSVADRQHYKEKQWKVLVQQIEDGLSDINAVLCEDVVPTFMQTRPEYKPPQNPHRDYSPMVLQKKQSPGRYPWIALIPLSMEGSYLFVWDAPGKPESLIHIPYGYMLFLRGDTVHAGGLPDELKAGPSYRRIHFYIPTALGDVDWDMTYADKDEEYYYHNL